MRIRSIKPDFWESLDTARLDYFERLLYIGLWSYVDDNGVGVDAPGLIKSKLFPNDGDDSELSLRVHGALTTLSNHGQITRYLGPDGRPYLYVNSWEKHQRINRPSKAQKPLPTCAGAEVREPSVSTHDRLTEGSSPEQGAGSREQGAREQGVAAQAQPRTKGTRIPDGFMPTPAVVEQMRTECPGVDLEAEHRKFVDYWAAKTGRDATKRDWDATWRNWIRNARPSPSSRSERTWTDVLDEPGFIDAEVVPLREVGR